jgi:hypothetical protein
MEALRQADPPLKEFYQLSKGKGKIVSVLILTEHYAMKAYWGVEI